MKKKLPLLLSLCFFFSFGFAKMLSPIDGEGSGEQNVLQANVLSDGSFPGYHGGTIISYQWRKTPGSYPDRFPNSGIAGPAVEKLVRVLFQHKSAASDSQGGPGKDLTLATVYFPYQFLVPQRILIDIGGNASYGGTLTTSPSINGNVWNNMVDARPGIQVTNALTTSNQLSGINIEVINRVDGTYSPTSLGIGNGNTAGVVNDYPASATTDHALIHMSAVNGRWRITGLQSALTYTIKFWGTRSNTTAPRNAEIKRADETQWKSYSATGNIDYNNAAVFIINGKTEMDFDIRTKAGSDFSAINVIDISYGIGTPPPPVNLPPVARAGSDTTLQLPVDSVTLRGCSSSDPEMAVLKYKWRKVAGPAAYQMPVDTLCAVQVKGLLAGFYLFELTVTDTAGLTGKDTVGVTLNTLIPTTWPPQVTPLCSRPYKIVVVGSSTAYGTGAIPIDSSWVNKFKAYLFVQNQQIVVTNIATPGLTSYDVSPTGTVVPLPYTVDTLRNITRALSLNPDAIILNLPSNDVARGIPTNEIHSNYNRIAAAADARHVPLWVTTTQPRDGLSPAERILQMDLRDWINTTYGNKSVDFWSTVANPDGTINSYYSAGDGVHLNNYGHHVLFTRIVEEKIWDTICKRINFNPIAKAGNDTSISPSPASITLNGTASYDPEGTALNFNWRIINNTIGILTGSNTASPVFSSASPGIYSIELKVTDITGLFGLDTIRITIKAPNKLPLANAGADFIHQLPVDSTQLNGTASFDPDGNIIKYKWKKLSGPLSTIVNDSIARPWIKGLRQGAYSFSLTVTDDSLSVNTDTVSFKVNAPPLASAGADQTITLPIQTVILNGNLSTDSDGTISLYRWRKISGSSGVIFADSTAMQTNVSFATAGQYFFELTITDNLGGIGKDTVRITVNSITNNSPVAVAGADQSIILPNRTANLNGSASNDNDGSITTYKWKKISGASSVIITDSFAILTTVTFVSSGQYLFELTVTDNLGAIGKDTVMITVFPTPNNPPVAFAGADKTIQLPVNRVLLDGRNSYDPEGSVITFNWTLLSGPAGSQLLSATRDSTSVTFTNSGTYIFRLTVTDNVALSGTDDITVIVLAQTGSAKNIKVNIYGGTNPYSNPQWNNWNLNSGLNSNIFLYEDGSSSNLSAYLSAAGIIADNGANYASAATACPPEVLRYNSANTSYRTLTFSGLKPAKKYNLEFYASRANTGNSTVFQIGNKFDTISTSSNVIDYAKFPNISPDINNKITVTISRIGTWNYLAGFMITEKDSATTLISPRSLKRSASSIVEKPGFGPKQTEKVVLNIYPNPAKEIIFLKIPDAIQGRYVIAFSDVYGKILWQKTGFNSRGNFIEFIHIKEFPKGMYTIGVFSRGMKIYRKFIIL